MLLGSELLTDYDDANSDGVSLSSADRVGILDMLKGRLKQLRAVLTPTEAACAAAAMQPFPFPQQGQSRPPVSAVNPATYSSPLPPVRDIEDEFETASWWRRVLAYALDTVLTTVLHSAIISLRALLTGGSFTAQMRAELSASTSNNASSSARPLEQAAFFVLMETIFLWLTNGSTPGKKLMGIKVMREDGEEIDFGTSSKLSVSRMLMMFCMWSDLWVPFIKDRDRSHQLLHNRFSSTVVVMDPNPINYSRLLTWNRQAKLKHEDEMNATDAGTLTTPVAGKQ